MKNLISTFLLVSTPLLGFSAHAENLIRNGSFEDASESPCSHTALYADDIALNGWEIVAGSVDYVGGYWQHADGNRSLGMNGLEAGTIAQLVPTKPGTEYTVLFDLAGNPSDDANPIKSLEVSASGQSKVFTFDASSSTRRRMGWETEVEFNFTAKKRLTELRFTSLNHASGGPALDNVRMSATDQGHVTARIQSVAPSRATCINFTTGQSVSIKLKGTSS
ncbi:MAG TPA: choice-of-anchor C family protein, partial [Gammaproteobacteria bacterium]|nr:choice-of-anchor C family protein [Gammaproteobacteria bacterium]